MTAIATIKLCSLLTFDSKESLLTVCLWGLVKIILSEA